MIKLFQKIKKQMAPLPNPAGRIVVMICIIVIALACFIVIETHQASEKRAHKIGEAIKEMESENPPWINKTPTEEDVYNNDYIKHIRIGIDNYLNESNVGVSDFAIEKNLEGKCGLGVFDKSSYGGKIVVVSAESNDYGGVLATIVFTGKPDALFDVWIYNLGDREYELRAFCKEDFPEEDADLIKALVQDPEYSL